MDVGLRGVNQQTLRVKHGGAHSINQHTGLATGVRHLAQLALSGQFRHVDLCPRAGAGEYLNRADAQGPRHTTL